MREQQVQQIASNGLPYSPARLLDARLSALVTDDPMFRDGCRSGFEDASILVAGGEVYTVGELLDFVHRNCFPNFFSHSIAYVLGGLSAIAMSQYHEAMVGLHELMRLLEQEQAPSSRSGSSCSVDSAGRPLGL